MAGIDVGLDLLDRLVVDCDGTEMGRVDDLRVEVIDGALVVTGLLVGAQAWGHRFGHRVGRWVEGAARSFRDHDEPITIPIGQVAELTPSVRLAVPASEHPRALVVERWMRRWFIGRIPGGRHASE